MGRAQVFEWFRRFKEGRTSVESDSRSGRPSTSRNEEVIAKVRTIVRNNRRLTVREIADDCGISVGSVRRKTTEKWRDGDWILHHDNSPRTHFTSYAAVFGQTRYRSVAAAAILTRSRTVWLFPIPKAQESTERTPIWGNRRHQRKFDEDTSRHPERGVRKMFPTVAETLGEVRSCGRELCWRQLWLKPLSLTYFCTVVSLDSFWTNLV